MTAWERVQEEFTCDHAERVVCKKSTSDGRFTYYRQCTRCGSGTIIKKSEALLVCGCVQIPNFDQASVDDWRDRRAARLREISKQEADQQSAEWWDAYAGYLGTERWARKREAVLRRDKHICQACLRNAATQCHHLTYKHVFDEPLFELIAVCVACHDKITALDRRGREVSHA